MHACIAEEREREITTTSRRQEPLIAPSPAPLKSKPAAKGAEWGGTSLWGHQGKVEVRQHGVCTALGVSPAFFT